MKTLCVYYTRSGLSKEIAEKIAQNLEAELVEVTDGKNRSGAFGYFLAAIDGLKNRLPKLYQIVTSETLDQYDNVIVVGPVWCEDMCPVIRSFLYKNRESLKGDVHIVCTHMSGLSYETKIMGLETYLGKELKSYVSVKTKDYDWTGEINDFVEKIKG